MRRIVLLLVLSSLAFAPAPVYRPDPVGPGDKALRGVWVLVSETHGGLEQAPRKLSMVFFKDHIEVIYENVKHRYEFDLLQDHSPPAFDTRFRGSVLYHLRYVYNVNGDDLVTCYTINKHSLRPTDFSGKGEWSPCRQVWKRKKP